MSRKPVRDKRAQIVTPATKNGVDGYYVRMPTCDDCGTNERVVYVSPDTCGHEFHCEKCGASWLQPW